MRNIVEQLENIGAETQDTLERFMDDEEMYIKYIYDFPDELSVKRLKQAVEAKDYKSAEKEVHALKGIANNLGFLPIADATVDMLEELRNNNIPNALNAYEDIKKQYKLFVDVIVKEKNN